MENEPDNRLLANFPTKSSEILGVFTHHLIRAQGIELIINYFAFL